MSHSLVIGAKTLKLSDLTSLGLNVPKFKAIDSHELQKNTKDFGPIAKKLCEELKCEKYAVRSSALIEDNQKESFAGQFKTKINVDKANLAQAIEEVTTHARKFLGGSIEKFSVLVQQYIEADVSGVTFTRNPTGGREMIIEHHKGRGEELVSGNIKPEKLELYWTSVYPKKILPKLDEAIKNFKEIEKFYKFPQDIEWCIKDGKWYFLQVRPITTISKNEYEQSLYLDKTLPSSDFYYEKTEISEIAPRPTQITLDILTKVYEENGPIQQVYNKFKIKYSSAAILKVIGNELFVDREKELKTLLPSYSYLKSKDFSPKLSKLSGIFITIKNFFSLNRINLDGYDEIFLRVKNAIENKQEIGTVQEFMKVFEKDYQIVFEVNLLAGVSIRKIENLIKNELSLSLLLSQGEQLFPDNKKFELDADLENLEGNTIEVADNTEFVRNTSKGGKNSEIQEWWKKLSEIKRTMLGKKIEQAIIYNRLREISRWLVVKRISQLRGILLKIAEKNNFKDKRKVYFAKLDEIMGGEISENICEEREKRHSKYTDFNMPKTLTNKLIKQKQKIQGVSPGKAEGLLVEEDEMREDKFKDKDRILFTRVLSPELVKYFDEIKGIVSEQGGFLSHLSIIARERGLPVVTGISARDLKKGEKIKIDGGTGKISSCKT